MENSLTELYLPEQHFAEVEAALLQNSRRMLAPLLGSDSIDQDLELRLVASPVDHCIRNLTDGFVDGPVYFVISTADTINAAIGRFSSYYCIVFTKEFYWRAFRLWNGLLGDESLRSFITEGINPDEPTELPTTIRDEALSKILNNIDVNEEVAAISCQLNYLLMYMIAAHEIGHLGLGHLQQSRTAYLDEATPAQANSRTESRAREWDADCFSLGATLYLAGSQFADEPVLRGLVTSRESVVRMTFVAAYTLFILLDATSPQDLSPEARTHPRPLVRAGLAVLGVSRNLHLLGLMQVDEAMDIGRRSFRSIEIALMHRTGGVMEPPLAEQLTLELEAELATLAVSLNQQFPSFDRSRISHYAWAGPFLEPVPQ